MHAIDETLEGSGFYSSCWKLFVTIPIHIKTCGICP